MPTYMTLDGKEPKLEVNFTMAPRGRGLKRLVVTIDLSNAAKYAAFRRFYLDLQRGKDTYDKLELEISKKDEDTTRNRGKYEFKRVVLTAADISSSVGGSQGVIQFDAMAMTSIYEPLPVDGSIDV